MIHFYHPFVAFLIIPLSLVIVYHIKPGGTRNVFRVASKLVITFIILLSLASPYIVVERPGIIGSSGITIIADKTESMSIFNPDTSKEVYDYLSNRTPTTIDFISGTKSSIGDAIVKNVKSGGNILLISDGNNNYGRSLPDALNFARSLNATIYSLNIEPVKKDMRVSIDSDAVAILGTPADYYINVDTTGEIEGDLKVRVDDIVVYTMHVTRSMRVPVKYSFNTQGSHTIIAELSSADDEIGQNNVFYRSVHVVPMPRILLMTKRSSPLSGILSQSYSVDIAPNLMNIGSYKAIVIDDVSASELSNTDSALLSDYVANGGGLIVIGGPHAFKDYSNRPLFEQLLPVKAGGAPFPGKNTGIVLVVDISGSTGDFYGSGPKLGIEKGLALQIINSNNPDDFLGVVAFNNAPHTVVPFALYPDRSGVEDTIARLNFGGTTHLSPALAAARDMVKNFEGGRNVIVISDGIVADSDPALNTASSMAEDGITIYAIGVGGDTDEDFMKKLAKAGGGGYLRRDQTHGIELLFGEIKNKEKKDGFPLLVINAGHFITRDIILNATVYGYNNVFTRKNAQTLVMTSDGNPIISTWRFGLGRVVSITLDNGNTWAPALYGRENSRIIITSANYAIGNPQNSIIQASDGEKGKPLEIYVYSDNEPDLRFDGERMQFSRTGERSYKANILANSTGFHDVSGYAVAVNEPSEYMDIGNDELLSEIITAAGGRVYNASDIGQLIPDITSKNTQIVREVVDLGPTFLLAALLLYSLEIIFRRIAEILR